MGVMMLAFKKIAIGGAVLVAIVAPFAAAFAAGCYFGGPDTGAACVVGLVALFVFGAFAYAIGSIPYDQNEDGGW